MVASQRAIRSTDTGQVPWQVIEATDPRYRNLATGQILLQTIRHHLQTNGGPAETQEEPIPTPEIPGATATILDRVDLSLKLEDKEYRDQLKESQRELNEWVGKAWKAGRSLVAVFEGWTPRAKEA